MQSKNALFTVRDPEEMFAGYFKAQRRYLTLWHMMGLHWTNSFEAYLSLSRWADTHPAGYPT